MRGEMVGSVTRALAFAKGLLGFQAELLAGCPPELLETEVSRYLETSKLTANVLPDGGLPIGTPPTFGCAKSTGPQATIRWFIASANIGSVAPCWQAVKESATFGGAATHDAVHG
jgi:hypothetical protein